MEDGEITIKSLARTNKVCRIISVILKVIFAVVCAFWIFSSGLMIYSLICPSSFSVADNVNQLKTVLFIVYGVIFAVMFIVFIRMFSSVAGGNSPFSLVQVKRLRIIAGMLLLYAAVDFLITANTSFFQLDGLNSGYASTNDNTIIPINLVPLIASAVIFAFSFVFEYGVLLQEFSDETL